MKKKITFTLIFFIILSAVAGGFLYYKNYSVKAVETGTSVDQKAPDFTLKNIYGEEVTLSNLEGKKVLLNFWATWCNPCQQEMPDLQKLYDNYNDEIEIIAVNMGENKEKIVDFLEMRGYNFPIVMDINRAVSQKYLVRAVPTSYFLNEKRIIINKHMGILNYEEMKEKLKLN